MPSAPDSAPISSSTLSCSPSLRAAATAVSGLPLEDALMISILRPAISPPRSLTASSTPRMPSCPGTAKGPSSVASAPMRRVCWAAACPARPAESATAAIRAGILPGLKWVIACLLDIVMRVRPPLRTAPRGRVGHPRQAPPDAEQAVGRYRENQEKDCADHEVEALAVDQVDREVLQQHEQQRAQEGARRVAHAADDGDDEDVDQRGGTHRAGGNLRVVPDEQDAPDAGQQPRERVRGDAMRIDVEPQRAHAPRVLAYALQRHAEGGAHYVGNGAIGCGRAGQR